jgi:PKD repeat protein
VTPEQPIETAEAPVVIISASPDPTTAGGTTTFDGSQSYSGVDIASYSWDFGDGAAAEGAIVDHAYAAAGDYTVTLTVTDANGQTAAGQYPITVQ